MLTQLPNDIVSVGYIQTKPFHYEQVFKSLSVEFQGTEQEFVKAGFGYRYTPIDGFTRRVQS